MLELITSNSFLLTSLFIGVFFLTLFLLPRIRENSLRLGFYDTPDHRSSHTNVVPTFGGVAFYIALLITLFFAQPFDNNNLGLTLLVSISIMFFIGLKDDLQNLSARKKFIGQLISVAILMIHSDFRIVSFHGFFGIYELNIFFSVGLSMFLITGFINAYNLIDGIDGMASIVGIVISSSFGFLFYKLGMFHYLFICTAIISMLFAFLRFNFSSRKKIFMGDTGALVIGLVLGLLALKLLSLGTDTFKVLAIDRGQIPLLILGILFVPTFDFFRVVLIRIRKKESIFSPDRNHIHHLLIDSGLSHKKASIFCGIANLVIVMIMFYSIREFGLIVSFLVLMLLILFLIILFFGINKSYTTRRKKVKVRNILFDLSNFFLLKGNKSIQEKRLAFNERLKKIRILFFNL